MINQRHKYPRTYHLSYSPGATKDDRIMSAVAERELPELHVVVTEKLDGENTTIYNDFVHARSINGGHHPSRDWVKALQARIGYMIPKGFRICGENMYAQHSIAYDGLPSYFLVFNVWNGEIALSWNETVQWSNKLGLHHVPVIYEGVFNRKSIHEAWVKATEGRESEGYVVRYSGEIPHNGWSALVGKWVRASHVKTSKHWANKPIVKNKLKSM